MNIEKVSEYARALFEAHGDRAEFEAAQNAKEKEEAGDTEGAEKWRAIRRAIREIRGPNES